MLFEKILFAAVCVTAVILFVNRFVFKNKFDKNSQAPEPIAVDYARSFFPVLLIVFLLRGFVVEPFRIPSGSMLPTLEIGDFVLVNKYKYGIRLPILHDKVIEVSKPKRGDIMVFRFPVDPSQNYIKRVIGLPGDTIAYRNKILSVNGQAIHRQPKGVYSFIDGNLKEHTVNHYSAELDADVQHSMLIDKRSGKSLTLANGHSLQVPEGKYFMMGDNRDNSSDSRVWGYVPEENIVGKAFFIWFHWDTVTDRGLNFSRIGTSL